MTEPLRTCIHTHETGRTCNSVAAKHQKYCAFHLQYRARQLRMAQARARAQRFHIKLPPLEDMYAVQSALSQLAEALAADMIDPKRAHALLAVLRLSSLNFRHPEKWQANLYHSDHAVEVDVAKQYGLPADLDLDTPAEVAFPPAPASDLSSPAERGAVEQPALGLSKGPAFSDNRPPATDNLDFRPDSPITPEWLELRDISNTQGDDEASARFRQLERNRARRESRANRKRYADIAMRLNLKRAADCLVERKLAEKLAQAGIPPTAESQPHDFDTAVAEAMKKIVASNREINEHLAGKDANIA
jgi:hypothetical protein